MSQSVTSFPKNKTLYYGNQMKNAAIPDKNVLLASTHNNLAKYIEFWRAFTYQKDSFVNSMTFFRRLSHLDFFRKELFLL